jgi:hypothetical protein
VINISPNYPAFFVELFDVSNIGFIKEDDIIRRHNIDDIINVLKKNGNMEKYQGFYNAPSNSLLFKHALEEFKNTLKFIDLLKKPDYKNAVDTYIGALKNHEDELKQAIENEIDYDTIFEFLENPENYKYIHYFWKYGLIGNNNYYSGLTDYDKFKPYMLELQVSAETVDKKQETTPTPEPTETTAETEEQNQEITHTRQLTYSVDIKNFINNINIICINHDFTRDDKLLSNYWFGLLCNDNTNNIYQINIIKQPIFKGTTADNEEFDLLDKIKYLLENKNNSRGNIQMIRTNDGKYYGKEETKNPIPFLLEIHKLDLVNEESNGRVPIKINPNTTLYADKKYSNGLLLQYKRIGDFRKETKQDTEKKLTKMRDLPIDGDGLNMFLFLLFRYTENKNLKKSIMYHEFKNNYDYSKYIYYEEPHQFIAYPDEKLIKLLRSDENLKLTPENFDYVIWFCGHNTYNESLNIEYEDTKTVNSIISDMKVDTPYPFTANKISKKSEG